jgi:hypothetical protein
MVSCRESKIKNEENCEYLGRTAEGITHQYSEKKIDGLGNLKL